MAKQAKQTKKFVKNRLDGALKDRKVRKRKGAQVQRAAAARPNRSGKRGSAVAGRANGKDKEANIEEDGVSEEEAHDSDAEQDGEAVPRRMTVEEFMGGGFNAKAGSGQGDDDDDDDEADDFDSDDNDSLQDIDELSDEEEIHAQNLAKLAEKDPEFFKYLQENDKELLDFGEGEESDDAGEAEPSMAKKKGKTGSDGAQLVTSDMLRTWQKSILKTHSLRALRRLLLAFRAAAHMGADDDVELAYVVNDAKVFNKLIITVLKYVPVVLQHHIGYKQVGVGKFKLPTNTKKYAALQRPIQSFFSSLHRLLRTLPEPQLLYVCVDESAKMVPYVLQNRRMAREYVKILLELWSTSEEKVRIAAFLAIRKAATAGDATLLDVCLRGAYRGLVRGAKSTSLHSMDSINLMKNSASELYVINMSASYQQAFGFIRQLAIHLRACLKNKSPESYRAVYNWQYVHCIDFWAMVLATTCDKERADKNGVSPMQPLIYPLVQAATGAISLIPTSRYFPMRLHVVQSMLRLMQRTGTYVPVAPILLDMLDAPEFMGKVKPSTLAPLNLDVLIRAPKSHLRTKVYADQLAEEVAFYLLEFLVVMARSIAFSELVIPILASLRRAIKAFKSQRDAAQNKALPSLRALAEKIERHAAFVQTQRNGVEFAPREEKQVSKFLHDGKGAAELPIEASARLARKVRADKRALLQQESVQIEQGDESEDDDDVDGGDDEDEEDMDEDDD